MAPIVPTTDAGRRVLDAASTLFYSEGITAVGVAGIAAAAGVTKKTLYDCFGSKAELVAAYLNRRDQRWWAHLRERLDGAPSPRVLVVFDAYRSHPELDLERGCAFQRGAAELHHGHPGRAVITAHKLAVRTEIGRLLAEDVPDDDGTLAEHLYLLLEGSAAQRGIDGGHGPDRAARLAGALLREATGH